MRRSRRSPAATVALVVLGALTCVLPLWRGGVDWPIQVAAIALSAVAFYMATASESSSLPALVVVLAAAVLATASQLLPVPAGLHGLLSPGAASVFETALRPLGLYPSARPFSLDPPTTGREVAKSVAFLFALTAAARLGVSLRKRDRLLAVVALGGVAVAGAGLAAALAGLGPLLEPRLFFVNPNHLAGYLNLTSFVSMGFALRSHGRARLLWLLAFAVAGAGIFFSLSRGGIAAFFGGAAVFAVLYVRRSLLEKNQVGVLRYAVVPATVSLALAVVAYLALDAVLAEMRTVKGAASEAKLALIPVALSMLRRFPVTGVGRGAFATVFTAYKVDPDPVTFTHVENEWLQAPVDMGIPVGLLIVGGVAWAWYRAARARERSRPEIGALAGIAALAAHNAVDFSLEILGVAIPFAVLLGLLSHDQAVARLRPAAARLAATGFFGLAALGMALFLRHPYEADAAAVARARSADIAVRLARANAVWHPADYLPQATAGARLVQEGRCADALPWLGRAMMLNPTAAEPHRFAGRCLAAGGKKDLARREYRLAVIFGDPSALDEAALRFPSMDELLEIVPPTPWGLRAVAAKVASRPADAVAVLSRAWEEYQDVEALKGLAGTVFAQGNWERALTLARLYEERASSDPGGYVLAATVLGRLGRPDDAQSELQLGLARSPGAPQIIAILAEQALASRRFSEARRIAESMTARTGAEVAGKRLFVARILWAQGRMTEAIQEVRFARDANPGDPTPRLVLADYCAAAQRYDEAIEAIEGAVALPGVPAGAYAAKLSQLQAARQQQLERRLREETPGSSRAEPLLRRP